MKIRVLVVDDDEELRALLKDLLESEGFLVSNYSTPHEALREMFTGEVHTEIEAGQVPIVLSDHLMPGGMTGLEFLEKSKHSLPQVPFIFMTAFGSDEIGMQARRLGAASFIKKPFSISDLLDEVFEVRSQLMLSHKNKSSVG